MITLMTGYTSPVRSGSRWRKKSLRMISGIIHIRLMAVPQKIHGVLLSA